MPRSRAHRLASLRPHPTMGLFDRKKKAKDLITPLPPPGVHDPPYLGPPPAAPPSVAGTHYGPVRSAQSFVPVSTSRPKSRQLAPSRPSVDVGPGQQQSWAVPSVDQLQSQQRRTTGPTARVDPTGGPRDDARRRDGNTGRSSAADERVRPRSTICAFLPRRHFMLVAVANDVSLLLSSALLLRRYLAYRPRTEGQRTTGCHLARLH